MKEKENNSFGCFEVYMMMRKTGKLIENKFNEVRKECGLKSIDIQILYYIYWTEKYFPEKKSGIHLADICGSMKINKGQVSTSLGSLEKDGYLKSTVSKSDKRITYFKLQKKGRTVCECCEKKIELLGNNVKDKATDEEIETFKKVFVICLESIGNVIMED